MAAKIKFKKELIAMATNAEKVMHNLRYVNGTCWWYVTGQQGAKNFEYYAKHGDCGCDFDYDDWTTAWVGIEFWDRHILDKVDDFWANEVSNAEVDFIEWLNEYTLHLFNNDAECSGEDCWFDIHYIRAFSQDKSYKDGFNVILDKLQVLDNAIDKYLKTHADMKEIHIIHK